MKHKDSLAESFASLTHMRSAIDAMALALVVGVISIAGEHESCSITFQKALLQGSIVLFVGALLFFFAAIRSEMAAVLAFISRRFVRLIKRRKSQ